MMRPLADAEPVPLAVAILNAKSLTRSIRYPSGSTRTRPGCCAHPKRQLRFHRLQRAGKGNLHDELAHVPRVGGAAFGTQAAVQADVLVLHHHAPRLLEGAGDEQLLARLDRWSGEPLAQVGFVSVHGDGQAVGRADVDAGVALDAQ